MHAQLKIAASAFDSIWSRAYKFQAALTRINHDAAFSSVHLPTK
jgi:hypothetical protein